ncbi:DUF502 domain-containing protein [Saccharolobus islandicus]|uniref:Conserved conjugative plasmid membrane protein n=1 Tax=Saccharolobus islandicus (strain L.D.8.5 / Lassen \|nr:hypothetical protein [Sulfolobus islandicus]ADB87238.1 conserved conjugative plasmid membrane protein [Sulfolobus islandicus L.D.8.5]
MAKRKAAYILLLIIALPSLALPVTAAANPIQNFANDLLLVVPPVLFILSLIALRKADYEYAFTLLLAAIIVTVALSAFQGNVSSFAILFYNLHVTILGPSSTTVNNQVSYSVIIGTLPAGWNVNSVNYVWLVYYNSSILVYNSSSGYVNGNYISGVSFSQDSLTFTPTQVGMYLVSYSIVYTATAPGGYPAIATGGSGVSLQVNPPPSPLSWISSAIVSAITGFLAATLGVIQNAFSFIGQFVFGVLSYALTVPVFSGYLGNVIENIYNELLQISLSLSLLFLGGSVAYNAIRGYYEDLIDIASDLFYKIGVWLFFTFGGLEIYNYIATFINDLIYEIINPYLPLLGTEFENGLGTLIGLAAASNLIPFGFGRSFGNLIADLINGLIFFSMLVIIRYFLIGAIVALIPLLATLWLFEWTRGVANALIDVLIGLILAGLVNTIILTLAVASGIALLFILLPLIADLGTLISLIATLFTIRPHEHLYFSPRKSKSSGTVTSSQTTPTPQTPTIKEEEKKVVEEKIYYM